MKSRMLITLFVLLASFVSTLTSTEVDFAQAPVGDPHVLLAIYNDTTHLVLVMEDGSIWFAKYPPQEKQTWTEWWYSEKHMQPHPKYFFNIKDWKERATVQTLEYTLDKDIVPTLFKGTDYNAKDLLNYPLMLQNIETGETLFAETVSGCQLVEYFLTLAKKRYDAGYSSGYRSGYWTARSY